METLLHTPRVPTCPIQIDVLHLDHEKKIYVLRDDLLPGGSKQRAVIPMLKELRNQGVTSITYASPFAGFAQVALAQGCQELGLACFLFAEVDKTQKRTAAHAFTQLSLKYGARVELTDSLAKAEEKCLELSRTQACHKIPLGFQCDIFKKYFRKAIAEILATAQKELKFDPDRFWLPVGSATLATTVHSVLQEKAELHCVDVHVLPEGDSRLVHVKGLSKVHYYTAPQAFAEPCTQNPPVPSNVHYDAKLWKFILEYGKDKDFWWNVAR